MNDWVATAPTPASAQAHAAPALNARDCTATPSSPVSGSRATIEYVTSTMMHHPGRSAAFRSQSVSARRSAIATVVRFVFARGIVGMTEASATITPSSPSTRPRVSTTRPIPQVPAGWK